jgi:hypothetical protein
MNINTTYTSGREVIYLDVTLCGASVIPATQFTMFVDFINSDALPFGGDGSGGGGAVLYVSGSRLASTAELYSGTAPTSGAWSVPLDAPSGVTDLTVSFSPTWPWSGTISITEVRIDVN